MSEQFTVSAIIPVHNGARHVSLAFASVLAQTMRPAEVLFVDDGSADDSAAELLAIESSSPIPVTIVTQENMGQSASRNAAAAAATGDLLAFLDQDDLWHPEHLARLVESFEGRPELGLAYSDFDEIDQDGNLVTRRFMATHTLSHPKFSAVAYIKEDTMILPTASVVRASAFRAVGGFDTQLQGYEDDDLWFRLFRAGWESDFLPESLARFRVHGTSSSRAASFRESRMRFFRKVAALMPDDDNLQRYYVSEVLVPRLARSSLGDYRTAITLRNWPEAKAIARSINELFAGSRSHMLRGYERRILRFPRVTRLLMGFLQTNRGGVDPRGRLL